MQPSHNNQATATATAIQKPKIERNPLLKETYEEWFSENGKSYGIRTIIQPYTDGVKSVYWEKKVNGKWIKRDSKEDGNLPSILYNLPKVLESEIIHLVQGQRCQGKLESIIPKQSGHFATTFPNVWKKDFSSFLQGKTVLIYPDNDFEGYQFLRKSFQDLNGKAKEIIFMDLPGLRELEILKKGEFKKQGQDVKNWIEEGGTWEEILSTIEICRGSHIPFEEEKAPKQKEKLPSNQENVIEFDFAYTQAKRRTEEGNSERIFRSINHNTRYVQEIGWIHYESGIWNLKDSKGEKAKKKAKKGLERELGEELLSEPEEGRKKFLDWMSKSNGARVINNSIELSKEKLLLDYTELDSENNQFILNVGNGVLDLEKKKIYPHSPDFFFTQKTNATYDPFAKCPKWKTFLETSIKDKEVIKYLQKAVGLTLTGYNQVKAMHFLYGEGDNGKSVFIQTLERLLGDYAIQIPIDTLMEDHKNGNGNGEGASPFFVRIKGKRLVTSTETKKGSKWREEKLKNLTSFDLLSARGLHKDPIDFYPTHKLWCYGNYAPKVTGDDPAIKIRMRKVDFGETIAKEKQIEGLVDILEKEELSGILNWAIEGFHLWKEEGMNSLPKQIEKATSEYLKENNLMYQWAIERLAKNKHFIKKYKDCLGKSEKEPEPSKEDHKFILVKDDNESEHSFTLWKNAIDDYREWLLESGYHFQISDKTIKNDIKTNFPWIEEKRTARGIGFEGLKLGDNREFIEPTTAPNETKVPQKPTLISMASTFQDQEHEIKIDPTYGSKYRQVKAKT